MRSMWKGSVSFGLVSIPIQLYAATENKNVSLRQVHEADGGRIQYKRFCTIDGEEVPYAEIAKGYELPDGEMVVLTDEDMSELPLASSRAIDVLEFVPLESIDPIQFDKTYYLEPQKNAVKPYVVLRDALQKASHVAVAKVAIRQRETLAILRVHSDVLTMTTMLWPDEVRVPDFGFLHDDPPQVRPQELTMGKLTDRLALGAGVRAGEVQRFVPRGTGSHDRGQGRGQPDDETEGRRREGRRRRPHGSLAGQCERGEEEPEAHGRQEDHGCQEARVGQADTEERLTLLCGLLCPVSPAG